MAITTVMFDLDGTLLPMDQEVFVKEYFSRLAARMAPMGYEPKQLVDTVWRGTAAMVKNDGSCTNEEAFWKVAEAVYGPKIQQDRYCFDLFYEEDFDKIRAVCGYTPAAARVVQKLKERGLRVVLATNPIFPARATQWRMEWAGLNQADFALYTTYENARHCKPNPDYYRDILQQLQVPAEACLMVGNDVSEDMVAGQLGMQTFLLTDCLINKENRPLSHYTHGDFDGLERFLEAL